MAIIKTKTLENGAVGEYWRIMTIVVDRQALTITGHLELFKDKATSDAGKPSLGNPKLFRFSFTVSELVMASNVISYIYTKIRAKAEEEVTIDMLGNPISERPFDPDLAGGVMG